MSVLRCQSWGGGISLSALSPAFQSFCFNKSRKRFRSAPYRCEHAELCGFTLNACSECGNSLPVQHGVSDRMRKRMAYRKKRPLRSLLGVRQLSSVQRQDESIIRCVVFRRLAEPMMAKIKCIGRIWPGNRLWVVQFIHRPCFHLRLVMRAWSRLRIRHSPRHRKSAKELTPDLSCTTHRLLQRGQDDI
jgi:hypothetical protein